MTKNPIINGLAATGYILLITFGMTSLMKNNQGPDTFMAPILMMSLFTLSAAVMGYLFCFEPIQILIDGKKKQAATLFLQTVFVFGVITAGFYFVVASGIL